MAEKVKIKASDVEKEIADRIVEQLKAGTAPWIKEWDSGECLGMLPYNCISKRAYNGTNVLELLFRQAVLNTEDMRWLTFNQATKAGAKIKKGAKGTKVVFWNFVDKEEMKGDKIVIKTIPIPKVWTVFNASQCEGLPEPEAPKENNFTDIEIGEKVLKASGAIITHGGNRAYYSTATDSITLPPKSSFHSEGAYYSTALHELCHWSGHESRLNRNLKNTFGSEDYAFEELVAEIASWLISVATGLPHNPDNHLAYVGSWVKAIQDNYKVISKAVNLAIKARDYVLGLMNEQEQVA